MSASVSPSVCVGAESPTSLTEDLTVSRRLPWPSIDAETIAQASLIETYNKNWNLWTVASSSVADSLDTWLVSNVSALVHQCENCVHLISAQWIRWRARDMLLRSHWGCMWWVPSRDLCKFSGPLLALQRTYRCTLADAGPKPHRAKLKFQPVQVEPRQAGWRTFPRGRKPLAENGEPKGTQRDHLIPKLLFVPTFLTSLPPAISVLWKLFLLTALQVLSLDISFSEQLFLFTSVLLTYLSTGTSFSWPSFSLTSFSLGTPCSWHLFLQSISVARAEMIRATPWLQAQRIVLPEPRSQRWSKKDNSFFNMFNLMLFQMEFSKGKCLQQHRQTEALIQDLDCAEQPLHCHTR